MTVQEIRLPDLFIGDDRTLRFVFKDSAGALVDTTGWTAVLTLRKTARTADPPALQVDSSPVTVGTDGVLEVALEEADTQAIEAGDYTWSLRRTNVGAKRVLSSGPVAVRFNIDDAAA